MALIIINYAVGDNYYSVDDLRAVIILFALVYPNHLKIRVSVGIKSDLGKALIASNSGSIVKINNAV